MADFLVPFLTGAVRQYMSDEDASDALKGNIIDNVSKKLYDAKDDPSYFSNIHGWSIC